MLSIKNIFKRLIFICFFIHFLCAWTIGSKPLDVTQTNLCTQQVDVVGGLVEHYDEATTPLECNRWGLKWSIYSESASSKTPSTVQNIENHATKDVDWQVLLYNADPASNRIIRLPTIKELVRIFEYDSSLKSTAGVPSTDHVFRSWLQATGGAPAVLDGYLISSTYRHINSSSGTNDGEMDGSDKRIRYLGVEIGTGKVAAFNGFLQLCDGIDTSGQCSSATEVNVYALLVAALN